MSRAAKRRVIIDAIARIAQKACRNGESGAREWPGLYSLPSVSSWDCVGEKYADAILDALEVVAMLERHGEAPTEGGAR